MSEKAPTQFPLLHNLREEDLDGIPEKDLLKMCGLIHGCLDRMDAKLQPYKEGKALGESKKSDQRDLVTTHASTQSHPDESAKIQDLYKPIHDGIRELVTTHASTQSHPGGSTEIQDLYKPIRDGMRQVSEEIQEIRFWLAVGRMGDLRRLAYIREEEAYVRHQIRRAELVRQKPWLLDSF